MLFTSLQNLTSASEALYLSWCGCFVGQRCDHEQPVPPVMVLCQALHSVPLHMQCFVGVYPHFTGEGTHTERLKGLRARIWAEAYLWGRVGWRCGRVCLSAGEKTCFCPVGMRTGQRPRAEIIALAIAAAVSHRASSVRNHRAEQQPDLCPLACLRLSSFKSLGWSCCGASSRPSVQLPGTDGLEP